MKTKMQIAILEAIKEMPEVKVQVGTYGIELINDLIDWLNSFKD